MNQDVGIVLSGGGARGIGHLGVLKVLEECDIKPAFISGTSAGAIVGAFYAAGYSIEETISIIEHHKFFSIAHMLFRKQGVFAMHAFENLFHRYFPSNSFDDLQIPLYAAATDILKGETVYFHSGDLTHAVMASSCIPIIFQPLEFNGRLYVDGGVLNNFPIEPLIEKCNVIIGSHVNSIKKESEKIHMRDILDRSFHLTMSNAVRHKSHICNVFLEPPNMSQFSIFDTKRARQIYEYSYRYALTFKEELMELREKL